LRAPLKTFHHGQGESELRFDCGRPLAKSLEIAVARLAWAHGSDRPAYRGLPCDDPDDGGGKALRHGGDDREQRRIRPINAQAGHQDGNLRQPTLRRRIVRSRRRAPTRIGSSAALQPASLLRRVRRSIRARPSIRNDATGFRRPAVRRCWARSRRIAVRRGGLPLKGLQRVKDLPPLRLILQVDVSRVAYGFSPLQTASVQIRRSARRGEGATIERPPPKLRHHLTNTISISRRPRQPRLVSIKKN
jgi:hypothetical protein